MRRVKTHSYRVNTPGIIRCYQKMTPTPHTDRKAPPSLTHPDARIHTIANERVLWPLPNATQTQTSLTRSHQTMGKSGWLPDVIGSARARNLPPCKATYPDDEYDLFNTKFAIDILK